MLHVYQVSKSQWVIAASKRQAIAFARKSLIDGVWLWPKKVNEAALHFYEVEDRISGYNITARDWVNLEGLASLSENRFCFPYPLDEKPLDCVSKISKLYGQIVERVNQPFVTLQRTLRVFSTGFFWGRKGYEECRKNSEEYDMNQFFTEEAELRYAGLVDTKGFRFYSRMYSIGHRIGEMVYKGK